VKGVWQALVVLGALGTVGSVSKKNKPAQSRLVLSYPGDDLLSHTVTHAVPSALKGLTSVFGKGTGVAPSLWPPEICTLLYLTMAQY
jgi:hypothetical protein